MLITFLLALSKIPAESKHIFNLSFEKPQQIENLSQITFLLLSSMERFPYVLCFIFGAKMHLQSFCPVEKRKLFQVVFKKFETISQFYNFTRQNAPNHISLLSQLNLAYQLRTATTTKPKNSRPHHLKYKYDSRKHINRMLSKTQTIGRKLNYALIILISSSLIFQQIIYSKLEIAMFSQPESKYSFDAETEDGEIKAPRPKPLESQELPQFKLEDSDFSCELSPKHNLLNAGQSSLQRRGSLDNHYSILAFIDRKIKERSRQRIMSQQIHNMRL